MSIWKRGSNLVKGMISEATKSDDPEKMRALEKELQEEGKIQRGGRPKRTVEETLQRASQVQEKEEISEAVMEDIAEESAEPKPQTPEKTLTPKKRTI